MASVVRELRLAMPVSPADLAHDALTEFDDQAVSIDVLARCVSTTVGGSFLGLHPDAWDEAAACSHAFTVAGDVTCKLDDVSGTLELCDRLEALAGESSAWLPGGAAERVAAGCESLAGPVGIQVAFLVAATLSTLEDAIQVAIACHDNDDDVSVEARLHRYPPIQLTTRWEPSPNAEPGTQRITWLYLGDAGAGAESDSSDAPIFGGGAHRCLGAGLANETFAGLEAWLRDQRRRVVALPSGWASSVLFLRPRPCRVVSATLG